MKSEQLSRYLRQFPFLWAIEQNWDIRYVVLKVERATERAFRRNGKYREDWWAYTINSEGIPALLGTYDFSQGVSISEQTSELRELPTVQLMMFRKYLDDRRFGVDRHPSVITIYRPPHGKTFEEFLKELQEK